MVKMVSLKKTAADKKAEKEAMGEPGIASDGSDGGIPIHLEHHHLVKMGVGGGLKSGHDVDFRGKGKVERSETRSTPEGDRHSATIRLHRSGIEHEMDGDEHKGDIRGDIEKSVADNESKFAKK